MATRMRPQVALFLKNRPRQARAKRTCDNILSAAAALLVEVGVERISTNLIAERAGITVPALYRYFPNKYAVLYALGADLMDRQSAIFEQWYEYHLDTSGVAVLLDNIHSVLMETYAITRDQVGGREITQALRAVQPLQGLPRESHQLMSTRFAARLSLVIGSQVVDGGAMLAHARLSVATCYALVEMALADTREDAELILRQGGRMMALYWRDVLAEGVGSVEPEAAED
ncbi:MAG: TetR/AcrR family transcriptional regulator [Parahaliea sp.]